ncbi:MAG: DUF4398 domain-containing protein [Pseudomonadota bacterium]
MNHSPKHLAASLAKAMAAATLLTLAACASIPPPTDELMAAESAIKRADEARVADYASPELTRAREKLTAARDAVNREDMVLAASLASQAKIDADVATAKAEAAKAQANIEEMKKANSVIQQESQRNSTNVAPVALPPPPAPTPTKK